jgi:O-antigen ligase
MYTLDEMKKLPWLKIKESLKDVDLFFFFGFLLTFPLSVRKVLFFYPINGTFNEWTGVYLYLSDLFLILAILIWTFIILRNKYYKLSIENNLTQQVIPKDKLWTKLYPQASGGNILAYLGLFIVLLAFISIFWSENQALSFFRSIKILELYLLAIYVAFRIFPSQQQCSTPAHPESVPPQKECSTWNILRGKRGTSYGASAEHCAGQAWNNLNFYGLEHRNVLSDIFKLIIFGGLVNSIIAIWQFTIQHSIGLSLIKESVIAANIDGVAKIVLNGHKLIRAYGLFPHPNILGGFLLLSIILTISYKRMFHMEHFDRLLKLLMVIQAIGLLLTFSKSATIGLIIALIYIYVPPRKKCSTPEEMFHPGRNVPPRKECSTWNILRGKRGTLKIVTLILAAFFLISLVISIFPNLSPIQNQSLSEREELSTVPRGTIVSHPIIGIGQGQLVWSMRGFNIEAWQFQPVHNVFLLIWSELGIIGLFLFTGILYGMFRACPVNSNCSTWNNLNFYGVEHPELIFRGILLGFIFIMLFDHYFWDIQQGQIILWLVLGFIYGSSLTNTSSSDIVSL